MDRRSIGALIALPLLLGLIIALRVLRMDAYLVCSYIGTMFAVAALGLLGIARAAMRRKRTGVLFCVASSSFFSGFRLFLVHQYRTLPVH